MNEENDTTFGKVGVQSTSFASRRYWRSSDNLCDSNCDLIIKISNHSFETHRAVIKTEIPYFHSVLSDGNIDMEEIVITEPDVDPIGVEFLIDFAYTGIADITVTNVHFLLRASHFFQVDELCKMCLRFLCSMNNVGRVRRTSMQDGYKFSLTDMCFHCIRENFERVSKLAYFSGLPYLLVKDIIHSSDLTVSCEKIVFDAIMKWVKFSPATRKDKLVELLTDVRLIYVPNNYLTEQVASHEFIRNSQPCMALVQEVKNYYLFHGERNDFCNLETLPRKYSCDGLLAVCGSSSIETGIYYCDFANSTWHNLNSSASHSEINNVVTVNGKVYLFRTHTVGILHLNTLEWSVMSHPLDISYTVVIHENMIYCFDIRGRTYCFDIQQRRWSEGRRLQKHKKYCRAVSLKDPESNLHSIYFTGGVAQFEYFIRNEVIDETYHVNVLRSGKAIMTNYNVHPRLTKGNPSLPSISLDTVEKYNPLTGQWKEMAPMLTPRYLHGCTSCSSKGNIYVAGGYNNDSLLKTAEVYDPLTNQWNFISSMNQRRSNFPLLSCNNGIYVLGGNSDDNCSSSVEVYDPQSNKWESGFPVPPGFIGAVSVSTAYVGIGPD